MESHAFTLNDNQRHQLGRQLTLPRSARTLNAAEGSRMLRSAPWNQNPLDAQPDSNASQASNTPRDITFKAREINNLVEWELARNAGPSPREPVRLPSHVEFHTEQEMQTEPLQNTLIDVVNVVDEASPERQVAIQFAEEDVHTLDHFRLEAYLHTSTALGLTCAEHAKRLADNGPNVLTPPKTTPWYMKLLKCFVGGFQILLVTAAVLCFILYGISGDPTNAYAGGVLLFVVAATGLFSYYQGAKSDSLIEKFNSLTTTQARVIRDGTELVVNAEDLVIGDLVEVCGGERVPADLVVVRATGLKVNNSSLTGESEPLTRTTHCTHQSIMETKNVMFCGTFIFEGSGRGVVFKVGDETVIGQVAKCSTHTSKPKTHLSRQINFFVIVMAAISIILAIVFLIVALAAVKYPWETALVFCMGILVANIPEGLLPQLCAQLYITAKEMAKVNVVVKNLEIIETLGCVNTIASDKTGTLTQNRMTVSHIHYDGVIHSAGAMISEDGNLPDVNADSFKVMVDIATLCSSATMADDATDTSNPTEKAIVKYFGQYVDLEAHRATNRKLASIPFNSNNKWMLMLCQRPDSQAVRLYLKGAPERVLDRCATVLVAGKELRMLAQRKDIEADNVTLAQKGERVLALAYRDLDTQQFRASFAFNTDDLNFPTDGLCFAGLVSLIDPPRPGVPESIAQCKEAGIRVMMVTGDHPVTAEAIARSIGILQPKANANLMSQETVVTGDQLNQFDDDAWDDALSCQGVVFARTLPHQKQMIVSRLQQRKDMVAVTGDGVNDSPALKQASCGIAMGITGSEIAKDAADIILMDDNFCSIIAGIRQGRLVFANMQKCIVYVVTHLVPEILPVLLYVVVQLPPALNTLMILSIDLGGDIPLGISLAWEEPESAIMQQTPRKATDRLTSWRLFLLAYFQLGILEVTYCFVIYFLIFADYGFSFSSLFFTAQWWSLSFADMTPDQQQSCLELAAGNAVWQAQKADWDSFDDYRSVVLRMAQTGFLTSVTITQIGNCLGCKTQYTSLFKAGVKNWRIWVAVAIAVTFNALVVYTPFGFVIFNSYPINPKYYGICLGGTVMMIVYHEILRFFLRRWPNGWIAFLFKY